MTGNELSQGCRLLDDTVRALCPIIEERINARRMKFWHEVDLRRELVGCVLGSQVRYEMAAASTDNLEAAGLLDESWWNTREIDGFESRVLEVLSGQRSGLPHSGSYRFPKSRAHQLSLARDAISRSTLTERLAPDKDPRTVRRLLVSDIAGLGPKQASMFLRNVGRTYDLAILDTHVLHFIHRHEGISSPSAGIGTFIGYELAEHTVVDYAQSIGYRVGYLDWAIWATMKAARELGL